MILLIHEIKTFQPLQRGWATGEERETTRVPPTNQPTNQPQTVIIQLRKVRSLCWESSSRRFIHGPSKPHSSKRGRSEKPERKHQAPINLPYWLPPVAAPCCHHPLRQGSQGRMGKRTAATGYRPAQVPPTDCARRTKELEAICFPTHTHTHSTEQSAALFTAERTCIETLN